MSSSLVKGKQAKGASIKKTLDIQHSLFLNQINSSKSRMHTLKEQISHLHDQIQSLEEIKQQGIASEEDITRQIQMIDAKLDMESEYGRLVNEYNEISYYTNTADILFKYYDLIEKGQSNHQSHTMSMDTNAKSQNNILKYFASASQKKDANVCNTCKPVTKESVIPSDIAQTTKSAKERSRGSLLDMYLSYTDKDFINTSVVDSEEVCSFCQSHRISIMHNDGYIFCKDCSSMEYIIVDHDKPSYRDPPKEISYFSYKRINHFQEWLNQIQGKETTEIPDEVYDKILLEIKKQRLSNMADLTYDKVKDILKKLRMNKYYEHIQHIMNRLNGLPMPHLSPELEEKLRNMFKQIQTPFLKYAPSERKNFLSYSYVLHKFIQLLEKDEYLTCFPLLKNREKLHAQDRIWCKICEELGWQFLPSL
jgi:type II secretory pathway component PulJ